MQVLGGTGADRETGGARVKQERCSATNRSGAPCSGPALPGRDRCWAHEPDLAARRAEGRRKGGEARSNQARARRQFAAEALGTDQVLGLLSVALKGVLGGKVEPGIGNAAANIARAIVAVREATELEERLNVLELAVTDQGRGRWSA